MLAQQIVSGLATGSLYALSAIGIVLMVILVSYALGYLAYSLIL